MQTLVQMGQSKTRANSSRRGRHQSSHAALDQAQLEKAPARRRGDGGLSDKVSADNEAQRQQFCGIQIFGIDQAMAQPMNIFLGSFRALGAAFRAVAAVARRSDSSFARRS